MTLATGETFDQVRARMLSLEFGIVANVLEPDRLFRLGAKAWIAGGEGGEGWDRFRWLAMARSGHLIEKWAPTVRFGRFRAKWIPEHQREPLESAAFLGMRGTRAEMEVLAVKLNEHAETLRMLMSNRRHTKYLPAVIPHPGSMRSPGADRRE